MDQEVQPPLPLVGTLASKECGHLIPTPPVFCVAFDETDAIFSTSSRMHELHYMAEQIRNMQTHCFHLERMEATAISSNNTFIPDEDNTAPPELIGQDPTLKA